MTTVGALLMLIGAVGFTVAVIAILHSLFGVWAGVAWLSLIAVSIGRFLVVSSGGDE